MSTQIQWTDETWKMLPIQLPISFARNVVRDREERCRVWEGRVTA